VLVTHSNCRALNPGHPRCKTDEMIKRLAAGGGVMGITSFRSFVKNSDPTTIEDVLDHFDHVAGLVGVEHVGGGNDSELQPDDSMSPEERRRSSRVISPVTDFVKSSILTASIIPGAPST